MQNSRDVNIQDRQARPRQGASRRHRHIHIKEVRGYLSIDAQHGRTVRQARGLPGKKGIRLSNRRTKKNNRSISTITCNNIVQFYQFLFSPFSKLTDISDDNYLSLMADNGDIREDLKIPDGELGLQLRADFDAGKELLVIIIQIYIFFLLSHLNLT